jgi:hypothetical protein
MNNATTMRAVSVVVIVVVLVFTTRSSASATSSPTPRPSATLTNKKHVINDIDGTIFAKDLTSSASDSNVSPQSSFPGAQSPGTTTVTLKPGTFPAVLSQQANATTTTTVVVAAADHNKCNSDDIITCTPKETHHPAKDTTPFDLPLPFP